MWLGYIVAMIMYKYPNHAARLEPSPSMLAKAETLLLKAHKMGKFTSISEASGMSTGTAPQLSILSLSLRFQLFNTKN